MTYELEEIMLLIWGFVPSRVLQLAVQFNIFEIIHNNPSSTSDEIAKLMDWKHRPTHLILELLKCFELTTTVDDKHWELTEKTMKWFIKGSRNYLGDFVLRASSLEIAYQYFIETARNDKPVSMMLEETLKSFGQDEEKTMAFTSSMNAMALEFADELLDNVDLDSKDSLLDVGCGSGAISIAIAKKWGRLKIDLFDLPQVANIAEKNISKQEINKRLNVISSDWNEWDWNRKYDVVLLSQVLHEQDQEGATWLLEKAIGCLNAQGTLIVIGICENKVLSNIFSLNILVEIGGDNISDAWLSRECQKNKVALMNKSPLSGGRMVFVGRKE